MLIWQKLQNYWKFATFENIKNLVIICVIQIASSNLVHMLPNNAAICVWNCRDIFMFILKIWPNLLTKLHISKILAPLPLPKKMSPNFFLKKTCIWTHFCKETRLLYFFPRKTITPLTNRFCWFKHISYMYRCSRGKPTHFLQMASLS